MMSFRQRTERLAHFTAAKSRMAVPHGVTPSSWQAGLNASTPGNTCPRASMAEPQACGDFGVVMTETATQRGFAVHDGVHHVSQRFC